MLWVVRVGEMCIVGRGIFLMGDLGVWEKWCNFAGRG